jgi:hypothetical protein
MQKDNSLLTITDTVMDRQGNVRWVVAGTFVGLDGSEPRCIDYRVRVAPETESGTTMRVVGEIMVAMEDNAVSPADASSLGTIPAEGIPRYVFEEASQARLLSKARASVERQPDKQTAAVRRALARAVLGKQGNARRGRPSTTTLNQKLNILADVEAAYDAGGTRKEVALKHYMSEGALRDLLTWARHKVDPPLFTNDGRGRRSGKLTDHARALLEEGQN